MISEMILQPSNRLPGQYILRRNGVVELVFQPHVRAVSDLTELPHTPPLPGSSISPSNLPHHRSTGGSHVRLGSIIRALLRQTAFVLVFLVAGRHLVLGLCQSDGRPDSHHSQEVATLGWDP